MLPEDGVITGVGPVLVGSPDASVGTEIRDVAVQLPSVTMTTTLCRFPKEVTTPPMVTSIQ